MEQKAVVKSIVSLFKQYPNIFPSGYMRFVYGAIKKELSNETCFYDLEEGYYFSWWQGKRNPNKWRVEKIVITRQGQGRGNMLMARFLKKLPKKYESVELKVLKTNELAIRFYKRWGFLIVEEKGDYYKMKKTRLVNKEAVRFLKKNKKICKYFYSKKRI